MIPPQSSSNIEDFIAFLAACYPDNPQATERRGADPASIAELSRLSGQVLPPAYDAYLREFGGHSGLANLSIDGSDSVADLLNYYADPAETRSTPAGGVVIARGRSAEEFILMTPTLGRSHPYLGAFTGPEIDYIAAERFESFLYSNAWTRARFQGPGQHRPRYLGSENMNLLDSLRSLLQQLNIELYWFSDAYGIYGESDSACFYATTTNQTDVGVRTTSAREADRICEILRKELAFFGGEPP